MIDLIYRKIGTYIDKRDFFLEQAIQQAGIRITLGRYVSIGVFILISVILISVLLYFLLNTALVFLILVFYIALFLIYPFWRVSSRSSKIKDEIPHALNYISIMAVVEPNLSKIFYNISKESAFGEIRWEFQDIYKDIEFFGADISTSLLRASTRTPSKELASTFNNIISMITAGTELGTVLRNIAESHLKQHYRKLNRVVDNLSLFAEIYIILAVFLPIVFMIGFPIVEVMSNFFGSTFGTKSIEFMRKSTLEAVIYFIIPSVSMISIIILDAIIPDDMKI